MPIVNDPSPREATDYVITESTYGDRLHDKVDDPLKQLSDIMNRTFKRGGNVIIPAFAVGRTQEVLYFIREIIENRMVDYEDLMSTWTVRWLKKQLPSLKRTPSATMTKTP
ncbi:MAG: hypothetical protein IKE38_05980, partial [Erysipelotrichaceae bacterium]|nr:hypothetical protein [Erysipelotrichaceae bacterium]